MSARTSSDLPFLDVESAAFVADPDKALAEARAQSWVARSDRGFEVLTYDMFCEIAQDPTWSPGIAEMLAEMGGSASDMGGSGDADGRGGRSLLISEGDVHDQLRRAVMPWFSPRRASELRENTRTMIERLVGTVTSKGRCEFVSQIASQVPSKFFCSMVGTEDHHSDQVGAWSASLVKAFDGNPDDMSEINAAGRALGIFVKDLIATKRETPGDDLVSFLIGAARDGAIEERDVASLLFEMLSASTDNTANSGATMLWLLCEHPDQWARLVDDRSLIPTAVEEVMRFAPSVRWGMKVSARDREVGGVAIPAKSRVFLHVASGNRDETIFADPDRFDVGRKLPRPQLVFGVSHHRCLGATLARMELQELLGVLLDRWREPALDGAAEITRAGSMTVERLPVSFSAVG